MSSLSVSVVIPTYNRADILTDAFDSALQQTYPPHEIIIVDDGSTDDTEQLVAQLQEKHAASHTQIHYIRQQNLGGNVARNTGIESAQGDLIAFLDSDDRWHLDKIEKQIAAFDSARTGAVYCGVQHMNFETQTVIESPLRNYPTGQLLDQLLVKDVTAQTSTYIIRKSVFEHVGGFDTTLQARQDWEMWIRIAQNYTINCVSEILVDFREHSGVRTASDPTKEIRAYKQIRVKYRELLQSKSQLLQLQARAMYLKRMARVHNKHNISKLKAAVFAIGAALNWPFDFDTYAVLLGILLPKEQRASIHRSWNKVFGKTPFAIRSH